MPPKSMNPPRGKPAPFKAPRPVKSSTQSSTKRVPIGGPSRATTKAATLRPDFKAATTIISSDEEANEDEDARTDSDTDELMEDALEPTNSERRAPSQAQMNPIPAPLLARLLHENFEDKGTQIQKGAMNLVEKYMSIFVQEAITRAKYQREEAAKEGGISDGFLQVEDLEKLAPQLVLDF